MISIQKNTTQYTTHHGSETKNAAKRVLQQYKKARLFLLNGNLGMGKTTWVKGLAQALDIREVITSPSFVLMKVYNLPPASARRWGLERLVHVDFYRLDKVEDLYVLGIQDYIDDPKSLVVIEWADRFKGKYPKGAVYIFFQMLKGNQRKITATITKHPV